VRQGYRHRARDEEGRGSPSSRRTKFQEAKSRCKGTAHQGAEGEHGFFTKEAT